MADFIRRPTRTRVEARFYQLADHLLALLYRRGWAAGLAYRHGWHGNLVVQHHDLHFNGATFNCPPFRIGFVSDLHAGPTTHPELILAACQALKDARIDLLLLGGDFVSLHTSYIDRLAEQLGQIPAPLGRFAVLGNHDLWLDECSIIERLEHARVQVLVNRSVPLPTPYENISICGLDDPGAGAPDAQKTFKDTTEGRIVLMHSPDGLLDLDGWHFDLALSGHTHGGQIALPSGRPIVLPRGVLCRKYAWGRFQVGRNGRSTLIVSRGVGCTTLPIRAFANPEVIICTITWCHDSTSTPQQRMPESGGPPESGDRDVHVPFEP